MKGNIGLVLTGYLEVPADGIYTFALLSDDGSTLMLDGELLGDNDGAHSPVEIIVQKALKARSEERRVGKECASMCRSRWSPYH